MSVKADCIRRLEMWLRTDGPKVVAAYRKSAEHDAVETLHGLANDPLVSDEGSGALFHLLEAIAKGLDHPLLYLWDQNRQQGHRPLTAYEKKQRWLVAQTSQALMALGFRKKDARRLTAMAVSLTSAFRKPVTPEIIRNWERDRHGSIGERVDQDKRTTQFWIHENEKSPERILDVLIRQLLFGPTWLDYVSESGFELENLFPHTAEKS